MLKRFAQIVTKWLLNEGVISFKDEILYVYIIESFLFSCLPLLLVFIISIALHMVTEGIIMILPFIFIRKFSGGFHFKSQYMCFIFSSILLLSFLLLIQNILKHENYYVCSLAVYTSVIILTLCSPIDCKERKLTQKERSLFKKVTIILSLFFLLLYSILIFYDEWNQGISLGLGIVIPAFLQLPCIFRNIYKIITPHSIHRKI